MVQGIEKIWELPGSKGGITLEVAVSEQYDIAQNISDVTVGLRVKSSQYYNYTYYLKGNLVLAGTELVNMQSTVPTHYVQLPAKNTYDAVKKWSAAYTDSPWTLLGIPHDTDGSKTVSLAIQVKGYTGSGGGGSGWSVSTALDIPLTHIPRASTVAATDGVLGGQSILTVTRRSADYSHSVQWSFGSLTGYLDGEGRFCQEPVRFYQTTVPFALPLEFCMQMPDCTVMPCRLLSTTYLGDTQIGQPQSAEFLVTAPPELVSPTVTGSVADCNADTVALTGDSAVLVRYASTALCTLTAQPGQGASLVSQTVNGQQTDGQRLFEAVDTAAFCFAAVDSRGYTAQLTLQPAVVAYLRPTLHARAVRTESTGDRVALTVSGACFTGSFGAVDNWLTASVSVGNGTAADIPLTVSGNAFSGRLELTGLDYRKNHSLTVTVSDRLNSCARVLSVDRGVPVFDWGEQDFRFHVPVTAPMLNGYASLPLAAYPVGAVFASVEAADPAAVLGGKWEALDTQLPFYLWTRVPDDSAVLGTAVLGLMKLGAQ